MLAALPQGLFAGYAFVIGACIGSFLNVVIYRLPAEQSIVRPGSRCPACNARIAWYDNIPLLSYVLLRARCRRCGQAIPLRYFIVELCMGSLSLALWMRLGLGWDLLVWLPLCAALLAVAFIDIDEWYVPDVIVYPAMLWVLAASFVPGGLSPLDALLGLTPAALALCVAWLFEKVLGREGLGFGDIKLLAILGMALGVIDGFGVLLLAAMQGVVVGLIVTFTGGHPPPSLDTGHQGSPASGESSTEPGDESSDVASDEQWTPHPRAIPFGPFLVLATFEVVLLPAMFANLPLRITDLLLEWLR